MHVGGAPSLLPIFASAHREVAREWATIDRRCSLLELAQWRAKGTLMHGEVGGSQCCPYAHRTRTWSGARRAAQSTVDSADLSGSSAPEAAVEKGSLPCWQVLDCRVRAQGPCSVCACRPLTARGRTVNTLAMESGRDPKREIEEAVRDEGERKQPRGTPPHTRSHA